LRPLLEQIDGFISIERFQSVANPEKILSLSFWIDEEAVRQWRNLEDHRRAKRPAGSLCSRTTGSGWRK
jgi:heme-degrading monooxygenase HmoA